MIDWLLAPLDTARLHDVGGLLSWHARLMVLAWAVLAPVGIIAARFFKVWPGQDWPRQLDDQRWWRTHRYCQYAAVSCASVALLLVLRAPREAVLPGPHAFLGWSVLALAATQVIGGLLRGTKGGPTSLHADGSTRGDHFDMSLRRLAFEYVHKAAGYATILLSIAAILSGLWQANAPRWMPLSLAVWWATLAAVFTVLQRRGLVIDTYHAIWGEDPTHPGHTRKSFGWGVRATGRGHGTDGPSN